MAWFTFNPQALFGSMSLYGRLVGDETGLWFSVIALLVAITLVGGGLLAFLLRTAREVDRATEQVETATDGPTGHDEWRLPERRQP